MSIRKLVWLCAALMLVTLAGSAVLASSLIGEIRMGGPLQTRSQQASDLIADILPPPEYVLEPWLEVNAMMRDPGSVGPSTARLQKLRADYDARHAYWEAADIDPAVKQAITVGTHESATRFWSEVETGFVPAARRSDRAAMEASFQRLGRTYAAHRAAIDAAVKLAQAYNERLSADAAAQLSRATWVLGGLGGLLGAAMVGFAALMLLRAIEPLAAMTRRMERMGRGEALSAGAGAARGDEIGAAERALQGIVDFSRNRAEEAAARINEVQQRVVSLLTEALSRLRDGDLDFRLGRDFPEAYVQLRDDFNAAAAAMHETIGTVIGAIDRLSISANEINAATADLSSRNELQAIHLRDTTSAVDELNSHVRATAAAAGEAASTVELAESEAGLNADVVDSAVAAMREIEASTAEVVKVTEVIDRLANQTHLLSLNASVEAARAGEAGKGFAVVSEEVRALAQNSGKAAHQIKEMIGTSAARVGDGVGLVDRSGQAVSGLIGRIREMSAAIGRIAAAATEQAARLEKIHTAISSIDQVTQQNAAMSEECSAAARLLDTEAQHLAGLTRRFKLSHGEVPLRRAA